jgi:uncharacterized protein (DUF427 family)
MIQFSFHTHEATVRMCISLTSRLAYYIPPHAIQSPFRLSVVPNKSSLCEWKGRATYHKLTNTDTSEAVSNKIWSYAEPTKPFKDIKNYLSFYASGVPWECFVDGEKVAPQEGMLEPNRDRIKRVDNSWIDHRLIVSRRLLWRLGDE